jgi:hypothetical protein
MDIPQMQILELLKMVDQFMTVQFLIVMLLALQTNGVNLIQLQELLVVQHALMALNLLLIQLLDLH